MKPRVLPSSALAFGLTDAYLVSPPGTAAPGASTQCSDWIEMSYGLTCAIVERLYGITAAEFESWNAYANRGSGCSMLQGFYYCVQINFVPGNPPSVITPTTVVPPTNWQPGGSATATPTSPSITTPTPTQTGMVSNCNKFYKVVANDGCYDIAADNGIAPDQLYAWNPAVGTNCAGLWPDYYICVGITGSDPISPTTKSTTVKSTTATTTTTTTSAGNGISTPTPTQSGMVSDCNKFYQVVADDGCYDIATDNSITPAQFYEWNPAVGSDCSGLWPNYYVCIGRKGSTTTATTTTTRPPPQRHQVETVLQRRLRPKAAWSTTVIPFTKSFPMMVVTTLLPTMGSPSIRFIHGTLMLVTTALVFGRTTMFASVSNR